MMPRVQNFNGSAGLPGRLRPSSQQVDRIDCWIRQRVVPCALPSNANLARPKYVDLTTAIGRTLKDQYDALAAPVPPHLAALVKRLEAQK